MPKRLQLIEKLWKMHGKHCYVNKTILLRMLRLIFSFPLSYKRGINNDDRECLFDFLR